MNRRHQESLAPRAVRHASEGRGPVLRAYLGRHPCQPYAIRPTVSRERAS